MTEPPFAVSNAAFKPDNLDTNATAVDNITMFSDIGVARWNVDRNNIVYNKGDGHTLSMYLRGGESSYRADKKSQKGGPDKICLMPQGHESQWHINGEIEFVHLYFSDKMLKQFAANNFATDVRYMELQDLVYQEDAVMQTLFRQYFSLQDDVLDKNASLFAEEISHKLMHHLIANYNGFDIKQHDIKGGLSGYHMRQLSTQIQSQLDSKHSIESLAKTINLSPFHFARMFKQSFGESPAHYITRLRIDDVKRQLKTKLSLTEISLMAGFSHQSHMNRYFKRFVGVTPGIYRGLVFGAKVP